MNDVVPVLAAAFIIQVAGALVLVAVIKNEMRWMRDMMRDHENRLRRVEQGKRNVTEFEGMSELGI